MKECLKLLRADIDIEFSDKGGCVTITALFDVGQTIELATDTI